MKGHRSLLRLIWRTFNEWWMNCEGIVAKGLCPVHVWMSAIAPKQIHIFSPSFPITAFPTDGLQTLSFPFFSWHLGNFISLQTPCSCSLVCDLSLNNLLSGLAAHPPPRFIPTFLHSRSLFLFDARTRFYWRPLHSATPLGVFYVSK